MRRAPSVVPSIKQSVVKPPSAKAKAAPAPPPIPIQYEDENLLVISKPSGVAIQGQYGSTARLAWDRIIADLTSRPSSPQLFPIHRLDKSTTGNLIFAKSSSQARKFSRQFLTRDVHKEYLAVVHGAFKEDFKGVIETRLRVGEDRVRSVQVALRDREQDGVEARTEFECVAGSSEHSLLRLVPHHGRKHQLRVHLAETLQASVVGDYKYGPEAPHQQLFDFPQDTILLHSYRTSLYTWSKNGKRSTIEAISEPPEVFKKFCLLAGLKLPRRPFDSF